MTVFCHESGHSDSPAHTALLVTSAWRSPCVLGAGQMTWRRPVGSTHEPRWLPATSQGPVRQASTARS